MPNPINLQTDPFKMENLVGLAITDGFEIGIDQEGKIGTTGKVRAEALSEEEAQMCATHVLHTLLAKTEKPPKFTKAEAAKLEKNYHDQIAVLKRGLLVAGAGADGDAARADALELIFSISRQQPIVFTKQREVDQWIGLHNAVIEGNQEEAVPYEVTDGVQLLINALETSRARFTAPKDFLILPQYKKSADIKDVDFREFVLNQYIVELEQFLAIQKDLQRKAFLAELAAAPKSSASAVDETEAAKEAEETEDEEEVAVKPFGDGKLRWVESPRELSEAAIEAREKARSEKKGAPSF